jgi:GH24 family phage-related lysozyme (muramidase)
MKTIPKAAIDLILEAEGIDQPGRWPGGGSGITLGYGCDIGADPVSLNFWKGILTEDQMARLAMAKGKTGRAAAQIQTRFSDIKVTREQAMAVFLQQSLPREIRLTMQAFPGSDRLPDAAFGSLVSLVYNRGTEMDGERRREMRAIRDAIVNSAKLDEGEPAQVRMNNLLRFIAGQFREMKRLWKRMGLDGLLTRREAEAKLVESAIV